MRLENSARPMAAWYWAAASLMLTHAPIISQMRHSSMAAVTVALLALAAVGEESGLGLGGVSEDLTASGGEHPVAPPPLHAHITDDTITFSDFQCFCPDC